jgi:hypothetical protein
VKPTDIPIQLDGRSTNAAAAPVNWYLSTLAFGDFVIDCNFVRLAGSDTRLLAANYLRPVAEAIGFRGAVRFFDTSSTDIPPSAFNARDASLSAIVKSLVQLRSGILGATQSRDMIRVPHHDIRWRLACAPRRIHALRQKHENIYLAYCASLGVDAESLVVPVDRAAKEVLVFPDSRQPAKQIPEATLQKIVALNARAGAKTRVMRVRPPDPTRAEVSGEINLWGLPALADAVSGAEAIVSADSLPGHLAEYCKRPAFILTPHSNKPLMPLSVLLRHRWARFDALETYAKWVASDHG